MLRLLMPIGVIGNTAGSEPAILGSNPGWAASNIYGMSRQNEIYLYKILKSENTVVVNSCKADGKHKGH